MEHPEDKFWPWHAPDKTPLYTIPAGVEAKIRRVDEATWRPYRTTKARGFERHEHYDRNARTYTFRDAGYQLCIPCKSVIHREQNQTQEWATGLPCPGCGSLDTRTRVQSFGVSWGVILECGSCDRFLRPLNHEELQQLE